MLRPFRYLFYRVYSWRAGVSSDHVPAFTTIFTLSVLGGFAASALFLGWEVLTGKHSWLYPATGETGVRAVLIWLAATALQYVGWVQNRRYQGFAQEFSDVSDKAQTRGTIAIWLTIAAIIAANIVLARLVYLQRHA